MVAKHCSFRMESNSYFTLHSDSESEDEVEQVHQWIADNEEMLNDICGVKTKRHRRGTPKWTCGSLCGARC